ncbi:MAG: chloride channel protein [Candidatus Hadarchaeales archaeon]
MKKRSVTVSVLFITAFKWCVLAAIVGVAVGLSAALFLKALNWSIFLATQCSYYYLSLPLALFVVSLIIFYLAPEKEGIGTEKVIESIHKRSGKISPVSIPVNFITPIITIASGGSAGKEAPCCDIGVGVTSSLSDILRLNSADRKRLAICGVSAGFASVFGTPIAGAVFGVEVLFIGRILYDALLPSLIAGFVSYHISSALGIVYSYHPSPAFVFSSPMLVKVVVAGVFFGVVSVLLIETMQLSKSLSSKMRLWEPLKGLIGGLILVVLTFAFSTQFLGLGLETINSALVGANILWYAFILKIIFTAITLSFGGNGGVITPIFFIGATSGAVFANLLGVDAATLSAIGLVSVLAGATNTPIASSVMAMELFGIGIAPYAVISNVVSFFVTGYRSIYPSQILAIRKLPFIKVKLGEEIGKLNQNFGKFRAHPVTSRRSLGTTAR